MNAVSLLSELGSQMGISGLQFDDQGCARLVFDGSVTLNLEHEPSSSKLQIYSVLGKVPVENKEHVFQILLEGNLFGAETGGAVLSLDPLEREIVLFRTFEGDGLTGAAFGEAVGSFVDAAEDWTARLANSAQTAPVGRAAPGNEDVAASMIRA
ncbi:type III secretion system chaperone [Verrucomicrobium spinosum]|uniref:type III secretion system chaperone n=1 Tax=Verrucomicrobium spinosum TaxID=2736 RepID=UPI0009D6BD48|nr:type III secretion system chaperone [Verrucomicrobium spinosum]